MFLKILILITAMILYSTTTVFAIATNSDTVKDIDLNLKDHEFAVTFLGLDDGENVIIQGADGGNILMNPGGKETISELDDWLPLYDIKEIKTLIITHEAYMDIEQIKQLIRKYHIKELIATRKIASQLNENYDIEKSIVVKFWDEGTKRIILPEVTAEVQFAGIGKNEGLDFTLQFFKHRLFFMTSTSQRAEQRLINKNLSEINIFKVPKVSSCDLLSENLVQYLNPQIAILDVKNANLKNSEIVRDLLNTWTELYFIKHDHAITIKFTKSNYEIFTIPFEKMNKKVENPQ